MLRDGRRISLLAEARGLGRLVSAEQGRCHTNTSCVPSLAQTGTWEWESRKEHLRSHEEWQGSGQLLHRAWAKRESLPGARHAEGSWLEGTCSTGG